MSSVEIEKVTVSSTERVIVEGDNDLVTSVQNQQIVAQTQTGTVVVTGVLGPVSYAGSMSNLADVDTSTATDGSLLVYSQPLAQWIATTLLEKQTMNGGFF
jgi:hypothetical protein